MRIIKKMSSLTLVLTFIQLIMLSLYFGKLNLDIGFSIKPYMFVLIIGVLLICTQMKFYRLYGFEWMMIFFVLVHSSSALNLTYQYKSLRFILAFLLMLVFYFSIRAVIDRVSVKNLEKAISTAGFIGIFASLTYYTMGILETGMNFARSSTTFYGVLIDRSMPRLTGFASNDPNLYVFFVTLYFFYTINRLQYKKIVLGCLIAAITIILTFSRGGILGIVVGLTIQLVTMKDSKRALKLIIFGTLAIIVLMFMGNVFFLNPLQIIQNRFLSLATDGGGSRFQIWTDAFTTFRDNPILGIGINASASYNYEHFGRYVYVHNVILEVALESGLIGLIAFLSFLASVLFSAKKLLDYCNKYSYIFVTLVSMITQMFFLSILYNEAFYFVLCLLYRYKNETKKQKPFSL